MVFIAKPLPFAPASWPTFRRCAPNGRKASAITSGSVSTSRSSTTAPSSSITHRLVDLRLTSSPQNAAIIALRRCDGECAATAGLRFSVSSREALFAAVRARFAAAFVTIAGSANIARFSFSGSGSAAITAALRPVFDLFTSTA